MKEILKMINLMEEVSFISIIMKDMRENLEMVNIMEMVFFISIMEIELKDNLLKIKLQESITEIVQMDKSKELLIKINKYLK